MILSVTRRLFTIASALSLLLCLGVIAAWPVSYRTGYHGRLNHITTTTTQFTSCDFTFGSARGGLCLGCCREYTRQPAQVRNYSDAYPGGWAYFSNRQQFPVYPSMLVPRPSLFSRLGFYFMVDRAKPFNDLDGHWSLGLVAPHWFLALLFSPAPLVWLLLTLRRHRTARRRRLGRCLACGYDLTGNVSGVCPECGSLTRDSAKPKV